MFAACKINNVIIGWLDRLSRNILITNKGMIKVAKYLVKVFQSKIVKSLGFPWKNCIYMKELFLLNKLESYNYLGWLVFYNSTHLEIIKLYNKYTNALLSESPAEFALPGLPLKTSVLVGCMTYFYKYVSILDTDAEMAMYATPQTTGTDRVYHQNPYIIRALMENDGSSTDTFGKLLSTVYSADFLKGTQNMTLIPHIMPDRLAISTIGVKLNQWITQLQLSNLAPVWNSVQNDKPAFITRDDTFVQRDLAYDTDQQIGPRKTYANAGRIM
jgi:hypothetical protein